MIISLSGKIGSGKDTVAAVILELTKKSSGKLLEDEFGKPYRKYNEKYQDIGYLTEDPEPTFKVVKFAEKLKRIVSILTGIPRPDLEKQEVKDRMLGPEWEKTEWLDSTAHKTYKPTVRWLLQTVGTEAMRDVIHTNVWVNALFCDYVATGANEAGMVSLKASTGNTHTIKPHPIMDPEFFPRWIISDLRFPNEYEAVKQRGGITIRITRPGTDTNSTHPSEIALDGHQFDYEIENDSDIPALIEKVKTILKKENILS